MSRLTRVANDGGYEINPSQIREAIHKLGKIEDAMEKEEKNYRVAEYKEIEEGV